MFKELFTHDPVLLGRNARRGEFDVLKYVTVHDSEKLHYFSVIYRKIGNERLFKQ